MDLIILIVKREEISEEEKYLKIDTKNSRVHFFTNYEILIFS